MTAWDRIINRIERTLLEFENRELPMRRSLVTEASVSISKDNADKLRERLNSYRARAMIVADEGRETDIRRAFRKMNVFNLIPSKFGVWPTGQVTRNITTERLIEDPIFKPSDQSYFIQLADCVAFSLLKRETPPSERKKNTGLTKCLNKQFQESVLSQPLRETRSESSEVKGRTFVRPSKHGFPPLKTARASNQRIPRNFHFCQSIIMP
jgi:hypothetical protein